MSIVILGRKYIPSTKFSMALSFHKMYQPLPSAVIIPSEAIVSKLEGSCAKTPYFVYLHKKESNDIKSQVHLEYMHLGNFCLLNFLNVDLHFGLKNGYSIQNIKCIHFISNKSAKIRTLP